MRFASFVTPHTGGTFSLHVALRGALRAHGIELSWLGPVVNGGAGEPKSWAQEADRGIEIEPRGSEPEAALAARMCAAVVDAGFDGVFVNVLADRVSTNLVRYLPRHILRVMVVHNITPATYAAARAVRAHVHATVGVSARCHDDLVRRFGFPADHTCAIPNAADIAFAKDIDPRRHGGTIRVIYLGRVEDAAKGVLWLPQILDELPENAVLTVAGDGPDLERLRTACLRRRGRVDFLGCVPPDHVRALLATHDALIMPSRFEGLPLVLVEAMAAGCVPVASLIREVTDTIVTHGRDGFLFPTGDWREAAHFLRLLDRDRDRRNRMAAAAQCRARTAFAAERMAADYAGLISKIAHDPPPIADPLALHAWRLPSGLRSGLRTYLPAPFKNHLRVVRERLRRPVVAG